MTIDLNAGPHVRALDDDSITYIRVTQYEPVNLPTQDRAWRLQVNVILAPVPVEVEIAYVRVFPERLRLPHAVCRERRYPLLSTDDRAWLRAVLEDIDAVAAEIEGAARG